MKNNVMLISLLALALGACQKKVETLTSGAKETTTAQTGSFLQYTIPKGDQYCDKSTYEAINCQEMKFLVKFDSSAIYQTINPSNQGDINKLFGFSDNNAAHHDFSARFGWRWSDNALRLFAYDYNNSVMTFKELGTVSIGSENSCSIKVSNETYVFSLNGQETTMPRASTTPTAVGYKLYPYFGGDEVAPHTISIWIKELP